MVLTQTEQNAVIEHEPDNATMTKDDFFEMLDKSSKQAEEGKVHHWHKDESIEDYVKRIEKVL